MCGIAGIVGCADREQIDRMTRILAHRGPDSWGTELFEQDAVSLGHRRLSILDLSKSGHQPMSDRDERLWITYNGEIYNFRDLRKQLEAKGHVFHSNTDTEVILYAYKEWGDDCLQRFNGMYAFAIWDRRRHVLFAARDPIGIKPFYYHYANGVLVFASEVKAIFESGLVAKAPDYEALHTPALYQSSPLTGFKDVSKLPPGTALSFKNGELSLQRYWRIQPSEHRMRPIDAEERLDSLIGDAVKLQMVSDVPVGAFLSGGLDSSLIVALMQRHSGQPVSTFTIRYADADQKFEQMSDDSAYARKVADKFGCRHNEMTIEPRITELLPKMSWHLDEPLSDPATINTYLISKLARENGIIVLLNGMGGDEVFGGYRSQLACLLAEQYRAYTPEFVRSLVDRLVDKLPIATNKRGIRFMRWAKRFLSLAGGSGEERYVTGGMTDDQNYQSMFTWKYVQAHGILEHHHSRMMCQRLRHPALSYLTRMCLADTEVYLPDHNLTYSDKCTMAASVEGRPPLTDHRIVAFMFSLHPSFRIRKTTQKYLLKKVAERYLPKEIVYRPKAPFGAPLRSWIRGDLSEMIQDYLSVASLKRRGIYDPNFVWRAIEKDRRGIEDNAHLIWRLLSNEVWFQTFF